MTPNGSAIIPALRYNDARAAIAFLEKAFGFRSRLIVPGEGEDVVHAQLTVGDAMIMLGTHREDEFGRNMAVPGPGGRNTQTIYLITEDPDAHYAGAREAGAVIVQELKDADHGGRGYTCRDQEGHLWSFGSYNPWVTES